MSEVAWAGGLFEGEGSLNLKTRKNSTPWPRAIVTSTDLDVLERFQAAIGVGHINGPYFRGHHKPYWQWQTSKRAAVKYVITTLWPYLGERRRSAATRLLEVC